MTKFKTPLISELRKSGGTFYTMPSATEDIGLNINESTNKVAMSHYVLLNLPDTYKGHTDKNYFNFNSIADPTNESNPSAAIAESLENYVFNFETALRNQTNYDYSSSKTVSEKVFWKWLQRSGALKLEKLSNVQGLKDDYYKEIEDSSYDPVVVGYGKVAASNYRSDESTIYNEVYVQVPSSYGMMQTFFRTDTDDNYKALLTVDGSLQGQDKVITGSNFRNEAFKDGAGYDVSSNEKVVLEFSTANIGKIIDPSVDLIDFTFDRLAIDNKLVKKTNYEFNAIALFYSIYDLNSNVLATNLFGIMFLDSVNELEGDFHFNIPRLEKKKSNQIDNNGSQIKGFGNGYSFRINLRTSAIYDDTVAEIEDYSTSGSEITNDFNTVLANLNNAISILKSNVVYTSTLSDKYNAINTRVIDLMNTVQDNYANLKLSYESLEQRVKELERKN